MAGERLGRLLADEAVELGGQPVDLGDVGLLARQQVLGGRQVVEAERAEPRGRSPARPGSSSASISERPRRRRSISTSRSSVCDLSPRRSRSATKARTAPIAAMIAPMTDGIDPEIDGPDGAEHERRDGEDQAERR